MRVPASANQGVAIAGFRVIRAALARFAPKRAWSTAGLALFVGAVVAPSLVTVGPAGAEKGIVYAVVDGEELELRMESPPNGEARPAVLLVHGGGWRSGNATQLQLVADLVVAQGWVAVSPDYRLDEDPGYPAEPDDIARAVAFIRAHAAEYGIDPNRIALLGSSAGGNVALETALRPSGTLTEDDRVISVVSLSGPTDLAALVDDETAETRVRDAVLDYLGCEPSECPDLYAAASPVEHVDSGDPAVFLANGDAERIPATQIDALADPLDAAGVEVRTMIVPGDRHGHGLTDQVWPDVVTFLQGTFGEPIVRPPHPNTDAIYEAAHGGGENSDGRGRGSGGGAKTPGTVPTTDTAIGRPDDAGSTDIAAGPATAVNDGGDSPIVALSVALGAVVVLGAAVVVVAYRRGRMAALAAAGDGPVPLADAVDPQQPDEPAGGNGTAATMASDR